MNLTELANHYNSDKGTSFFSRHNYTSVYEILLGPMREQKISFLELGLAVGGPETAGGALERMVDAPSVRMWLDYFPAAHVTGFDISDFSHVRHDRFTFVRGDSSVEADLRALACANAPYDVIIDDASHASYHQQLAFRVLWPHLKPGGAYVVEDLHWQSPVFERSMPKTELSATYFPKVLTAPDIPNGVFSEEFALSLRRECATHAVFGSLNGDGHDAKLLICRKKPV